MEINEVKLGDTVTFTHNKKKVTGKVVYRHDDKDKAALLGHVNVQVLDNKSYPVTVHVSKLKPALKEETMEQNSKNISEQTMELIDYIDSANHLEAEKKFNDLLQDKIDALLGVAKEEVAKTMFNTQECVECEEQNEETEIEEGMVKAANKAKSRAYVKSVGTSPKSPQGWSGGHETDAAYDKRVVRAGREALKAKSQKEETEVTNEALKGGQHKIDANKNGKIDAHDFKMLRKKKGMKEETGVEEAVVIKPTSALQSAIDAYKKKKAAASSTEVPKTRETPAVKAGK